MVVIRLLELAFYSPLRLAGRSGNLVQVSIDLPIEHIIIFDLSLGVN